MAFNGIKKKTEKVGCNDLQLNNFVLVVYSTRLCFLKLSKTYSNHQVKVLLKLHLILKTTIH